MSTPWSRFTPEQARAALLVDRPMLAAAGAGAGKTAVLAVRYVAALLDRDERDALLLPERILALAFTREAAVNLRTRIDRTLRAVLQAGAFPRPGQGGDGVVDVPLSASEAEHLRRAASDLPAAPITTVDGWCLRLVTEFAALLNRDPDLGPPESLAWQQVTDRAWRSLRARLIAEQDPAAALLVQAFGEQVLRQRLAALVNQVGAMPTPCLLPLGGEAVALLRARRANEVEALAEDIALAQSIGAGGKGGAAIAALSVTPPADDAGFVAWCTALEGLSGNTAVALKDAVKRLQDLVDAPAVRSAAGDRPDKPKRRSRGSLASLAGYDAGLEADLLARATATAALALRLRQHQEEAATQAGLAGFASVSAQALRLFDDAAARTRLHRRYRHILLDEAQDLNRLQGRLIERLHEGAAASGSARIFTVGDARQSIFGFRHADPAIFADWRTRLGHVAELAENFRTHPALVVRVRDIFGQESLRRNFDVAAIRPGRDAGTVPGGGALHLHRVVMPPADDGKPLRAGSILGSQAMARQVAALVAGHIADGIPAEGQAILLRQRSRMAIYAQALEDAGIPYDAGFRTGFLDSQEVHDCEALLRLAVNPQDRRALAVALAGPWGLGDPQDRRLWARLLDGDAQQAWQHPAVATLATVRTSVAALVQHQGVAAAIRHLIADPCLAISWATLPLARQRLANLVRLAQEEDRAGTPLDVVAFLQRLTLRRDLDVDEARASGSALGSRGVRLLTVHASKGLEWPVVFLPELDQGFSLRDLSGTVLAQVEGESLALACRPGSADPEGVVGIRAGLLAEAMAKRLLAEEARLFYVSCTRAREIMHGLIAGEVPAGPLADDSVTCPAGWLAAEPWQDVEADITPGPVGADVGGVTSGAAQGARDLPAVTARAVAIVRPVTELLSGPPEPVTAGGRADDLNRQLGIALHEALAAHGPGMSSAAATAALAPYAAQLPPLRRDRLLRSLTSSDLVSGYWDARVRLIEQPMVGELIPGDGSRLVEGIADLLLARADGWHLYDFKSGQAATRTESRQQLQAYAWLLRPHLDAALVGLWLVDLETGTHHPVPADDLSIAAHLAKAWDQSSSTPRPRDPATP